MEELLGQEERLEAELKSPGGRGVKAGLDEQAQALVRRHAPEGAVKISERQPARAASFKSGLPATVRKHLLGKKKKGVDIVWLTAVLNMKDKLDAMFTNLSGRPNDPNINLGLKYAASGANIWSNDYVKEKARAAAQTAAPEKPIAEPL